MGIYTVNGQVVKYDNKWLGQEGASPSSELPPYDSSDAGKALVVNDEGDAVEWQDVGSAVTVDQHYDASSTNPQSGTAVAEALRTVSFQGYDDRQFKLSTYEYPKNDSVLYSTTDTGVICTRPLCGTGSSTAPSIADITIRDKMCLSDGTGGVWFRLAAPATTTTSSVYGSYGRAFTCSREMGAAGLRPILFQLSDNSNYYTFPNTIVPACDGAATNPSGYQCGFVGKVMDASTHQEVAGWRNVDQGMAYPDYSYWEILIHLTQADMVDANGDPSAVAPSQLIGGSLYWCIGFFQPGTTGLWPNGCDGASWANGGGFANYASTYQIQPGLLQNKYGTIPEFSSTDNGKVLGVVDGHLAWVTP